jgi:hypothetical protein
MYLCKPCIVHTMMNRKTTMLMGAICLVSALMGFSIAIIFQGSLGGDEYRVRYYASLVKSLDAVNSKSDFAAAASVIEELRTALRTRKVTSDEVRAELPKAHLSDGWVRVYELSVNEYHVEALLEKVEALSKKQVHEEGDWENASALSKEAIRLHESIMNSRLLIPRFKINKALLEEQVELAKITSNVALPSKAKRR